MGGRATSLPFVVMPMDVCPIAAKPGDGGGGWKSGGTEERLGATLDRCNTSAADGAEPRACDDLTMTARPMTSFRLALARLGMSVNLGRRGEDSSPSPTVHESLRERLRGMVPKGYHTIRAARTHKPTPQRAAHVRRAQRSAPRGKSMQPRRNASPPLKTTRDQLQYGPNLPQGIAPIL